MAISLVASPAAAQKPKSTAAKIDISMVSSDGPSRSNRGSGTASGVLQDSGSGLANHASRRDRDSNSTVSRARSTQNARIEMIRSATASVNRAFERTHLLHRQYTLLSEMTPEEVALIFPDGQYLAFLQDAAERYNASVEVYYAAVARLDTAKSQLTGGQELTGSVLSELNALLGQ